MAAFDFRTRKIVIADDDLDDQMLLKEAVEHCTQSCEIVQLPDGFKLMNYLEANTPPSLVLLDLNMPNKTGLECLREIRADKRLSELPVIVLSTSKGRRDIEAAYDEGASLFFSKPCTFAELNEMVNLILSVDWLLLPRPMLKQEFVTLALQGSFSRALPLQGA